MRPSFFLIPLLVGCSASALSRPCPTSPPSAQPSTADEELRSTAVGSGAASTPAFERRAPEPEVVFDIESADDAIEFVDRSEEDLHYVGVFRAIRGQCSVSIEEQAEPECWTEFVGGCLGVSVDPITQRMRAGEDEFQLSGTSSEPRITYASRELGPARIQRACATTLHEAIPRYFRTREACESAFEERRCEGRECQIEGMSRFETCSPVTSMLSRLEEPSSEEIGRVIRRIEAARRGRIPIWELDAESGRCQRGTLSEREGTYQLTLSSTLEDGCRMREQIAVQIAPYRYEAAVIGYSTAYEGDDCPGGGAFGAGGYVEPSDLAYARDLFSFDGRWFFVREEACQAWER